VGYPRAITETKFVWDCIDSKIAALKRSRLLRERLLAYARREARVSPLTFPNRLRVILSGTAPSACIALLIDRFFDQGHYLGGGSHRIGDILFFCESAHLRSLQDFALEHPLRDRIHSIHLQARPPLLKVLLRAAGLHPEMGGPQACRKPAMAMIKLKQEASAFGAPSAWPVPGFPEPFPVAHHPSWEQPDWLESAGQARSRRIRTRIKPSSGARSGVRRLNP
jgi:hypothetical protein